jgi:glycosyltransferase involved in cell wall biosynthesis
VRVSHYFEWEGQVTGGHAQSVRNQRTILDRHGIDYTTDPDPTADLLHLNNMGPRSLLAARRAHAHGTPVVVHAHQTAEDFRGSFALSDLLAVPMRPYLERAYSLADLLICPSEHNRRVLREYTETPKTVVSNGFDPEKVAGHEQLREQYRDRYDLSGPVVFTVGHVIERKGLSAFVRTARRMPDVEFVWFGYLDPTGGGPLDDLLRKRSVDRLVDRAPENCTFTGYVEDVRGAFGAGDVFFFPTHNENEGMALLEAMACGRPPVVRDIETFEWLTHGEDALKADGDFEAPLRRLVEDPDERDRLGAAARERSDAYTLTAVGEDLVEVYERLLAAVDRD